MAKFNSPLNKIRIASPCSANWDEMYGNERRRFCGECKLNVYNLSGMTKFDAENLIAAGEGRVCVRYFRRTDGTVITADCPVGWERLKRRAISVAGAVFSLFIAISAGLLSVAFLKSGATYLREVRERVVPKPEPVLMGAIAMPPEQDHPPSNGVKGS
ncbi:MAG: hypothetical protein AB7Q37_01195 [Pyrinomonadaceae bacterium]